jgi:glycyl-tRNA synthetase beta chain
MTDATAADFLVELGTEELPPKALVELRDAFRNALVTGLAGVELGHGAVEAFATPRRLAVLIHNLQTEQGTRVIEHRGPPVNVAYDKNGAPTRAAEAFAAKCGVTPDKLSTVSSEKGEWLAYRGTVPGEPAAQLIPAIVGSALAGLPVPKRMRWGNGDIEFVRPAHWLVLMLGDDVVPASIMGLRAGRVTRGHRFMAPGEISLPTAGAYAALLEEHGSVVADFAARRSLVEAGARQAAAGVDGEAILDRDVLDEVTALVEWPVSLLGKFDARFLALPPEVLMSTLQDHQRYFPVRRDGELLPYFVATSNLESRAPEEVVRGNERVVLPRLADAEFFWNQDIAMPLAARQDALAGVIYQQGLGSLRDKAGRVSHLSGLLQSCMDEDIAAVGRAAQLARTDLLTQMVGEFPELQGRMGYYYATHDGEPEAVAVAIEEQYLPRHAGDRLPATRVGQALGIADRLDTLAGIFSLGKRPSGNKDPFGLRRQALGLVRILIECGIDIDLRGLLAKAVSLQPVKQKESGTADELYDFVLERLRTWYLAGQAPQLDEGAVSSEMFDAVRSRAPLSPLDFHQRLLAVQQFAGLDDAASLAAANKRIANLLRKSAEEEDAQMEVRGPAGEVKPDLFSDAEERALHESVNALLPGHAADLERRNYAGVLLRLAGLRPAVDAYFDKVMVMADEPTLRANRLTQLRQLRALFLDVADISAIPSSHG